MNNKDKQIARLKQKVLKYAEERAGADALFQSIGEGAIAVDDQGKISRVNKVALDTLGFSQKDLLGKWYPNAIIATDAQGNPIPYIKRPIAQAIISGKPMYSRTYYIKKDGSPIPVSSTVSPTIIDNKPVGAVMVFRDITEELQVERMKSEFISLASHQLRTPATAVKNYIAMLREGYAGELTQEQLELAELAYDSNERQIAIVNDLLFVAQTEASSLVLNKQPVDLKELIGGVLQDHQGTISDRNQQVNFKAPTKPVITCVDNSYFKMVVDNLISNASKYTPKNGKITTSLQELKGEVKLSVKDNGVGIHPDDMDKLFKKFSRINNPLSVEVGGSGIGLYLLKQIVELHEGSIIVKSLPAKGTEFIVKLPKLP